ncbi:hypothetical protein [Actinacidiphila yanglinensis]|uniref:hypothetical protein n=1 Tax=Actinacidiphila yanglinensis TaxID=310779 RepID=UPI000CDEF2B3|nr:hypothetical protein [Actinacidiphila yanglinensis]
MKSQQPSDASDQRGHDRDRHQEQERVRADGLRKVAVASAAALAAVLAFAVATAGSEHGVTHRGNAGHSTTSNRASSDE